MPLLGVLGDMGTVQISGMHHCHYDAGVPLLWIPSPVIRNHCEFGSLYYELH